MRRRRLRRARVVTARALVCAGTLAMIALAPVIVLVGEPLRRYYLRGAVWRRRRLLGLLIANPVFIALTAPSRFAIDQVVGRRCDESLERSRPRRRGFGRFRMRGFGTRGGGNGGDWPPPAGVREPRRPRPSAPAGAIALAEPRQQHRVVTTLKALPPTLSEPVRRVRSRLGRLAGALRAWVSAGVRWRPWHVERTQ